MHPILHVAVKAARRAGKIILRYSERLDRVEVRQKGRNDFVSAVDRMAEDEIVDEIQRRYPSHRILAEERESDAQVAAGAPADGGGAEHDNGAETGGVKNDMRKKPSGAGKHGAKNPITETTAETAAETTAETAADRRAITDRRAAATDRRDPRNPADDEIEWIIDPLDGTANYLHGHPHYAVSIAVRHHGRLQHAVIFDPLRDELYTASRGGGAHLNDRRIRVTGQRNLARALLATGFPFRAHADLDAWLCRFRELMPRVADMRRCGSAALDLAYVAAGRLDGFWEPGLAAWDIAAGALLVREAGGFVADFQGGQNFLESGEVVAANQHVFNELLMCIMSPPRAPAP